MDAGTSLLHRAPQRRDLPARRKHTLLSSARELAPYRVAFPLTRVPISTAERVRRPRAEGYGPLPGGSGIMPAGTTTGARGASLQENRRRVRLCPLLPAAFREAWPEAEPSGRKSRWREPSWNAGRRARPQAEGGASRLTPWRVPHAACVRAPRQCVCRRSASFCFLLRSFLFRHCRTTGSGPKWPARL